LDGDISGGDVVAVIVLVAVAAVARILVRLLARARVAIVAGCGVDGSGKWARQDVVVVKLAKYGGSGGGHGSALTFSPPTCVGFSWYGHG